MSLPLSGREGLGSAQKRESGGLPRSPALSPRGWARTGQAAGVFRDLTPSPLGQGSARRCSLQMTGTQTGPEDRGAQGRPWARPPKGGGNGRDDLGPVLRPLPPLTDNRGDPRLYVPQADPGHAASARDPAKGFLRTESRDFLSVPLGRPQVTGMKQSPYAPPPLRGGVGVTSHLQPGLPFEHPLPQAGAWATPPKAQIEVMDPET